MLILTQSDKRTKFYKEVELAEDGKHRSAIRRAAKDGVSITEDLLPIGKCCYCGYENEHYVCELCGTVYDDMGGDDHLCNGCMPRDD